MVMFRSAFEKVLLREGDGVLGTHRRIRVRDEEDVSGVDPTKPGGLERVPRIMRAGCGRSVSCCIVMI
jgi:hypothetical protein